MQREAVFPGSFDPFTLGHQKVVEQGLELFDKIIIAVGTNAAKQGLLPPAKRVELIQAVFRGNSRVEVTLFEGLTVSFCQFRGSRFVLRGMRNSVDFEFERNMMQINRTLYPELRTVPLFTPPEFVAISSSVVRELVELGGDPAPFMPHGIKLKDYL